MENFLYERMLTLAHRNDEKPEQVVARAQMYVNFIQQDNGADAEVPAKRKGK